MSKQEQLSAVSPVDRVEKSIEDNPGHKPSTADHSSQEDIEKRRRKRQGQKKYCGGCWRVEKHLPLNRNKSQVAILTILTLGIYLLIRRFRCRVCGRTRMAIGA